MTELNFPLEAPAWDPALASEVAALHAKLDRLTEMVAVVDQRRQELEELVTDLMPAVNGAVLQATRQLDALERSGALAVLQEGVAELRVAAERLDPQDLRALGESVPAGIRSLRAVMEPEVAAVAEAAVAGIRVARTGRPPSLRQLLRSLREPHVRRGLGAVLAVLRALGEGGGAGVRPQSRAAGAAPRPRPAPSFQSRPPAAPAAAPDSRTVAIAGHELRVDAEGFLVDREAWTPEIAAALAREAGIPSLTERHRQVIDFCRSDAAAHGGAPGLRRISQELSIDARELYALFPGGPGILAARIAGLEKPKSCV